MQEEIKCPNCGGNKFSILDNNTYKCVYCGTRFNNNRQTENKEQSNLNQQYNNNYNQQYYNNYNQQSYVPRSYNGGKNRITAALFAIILGGLGIHHFYLGRIWLGILYIVFCFTWIPSIIGIIEGIILLCMSDQEFDNKYNIN